MALFNLPDELMLIIAEYLQGRSLASFNQTCKNAWRIASPLLDKEKAGRDLKSLHVWDGKRVILEFNTPHKKGIEIDKIISYNKLIMASEAGDIQQVKALLATEGASANPPNAKPEWEYKTFPFFIALEGAAHANQLAAVQFLLEAGATLPYSADTTIRLVGYGEFNENLMQLLIRHDLFISPTWGSAPNLLHAACTHGAPVALIKWLIKHYPRLVDVQDGKSGETPLSIAARGNRSFDVKAHLSVIRELVRCGVKIERPCNAQGRSALCIAAEAPGNKAVVRLLLGLRKMKGDHDGTQNYMEAALYYAIQKPRNGKIVQMLLRAGAGEDRYVLSHASRADPEMAKLLYEVVRKKHAGKEPRLLLELTSALGYLKQVKDFLPQVEAWFPSNTARYVAKAGVTAADDKTMDCFLSYAINAALDARRAIFEEAVLLTKTLKPIGYDSTWCRRVAREALCRTLDSMAVLLNLLCDVLPSGEHGPVLCAVLESGNLSALEILLSRLTPPENHWSLEPYPPLRTAVDSGHFALLEALLKWCPSDLVGAANDMQLLCTPVERNQPEVVKVLLKAGFDPTIPWIWRKLNGPWRLLEYSVSHGFTELVHILLAHEGITNLGQKRYDQSETPLLNWAVDENQIEMARLLLDHYKADVNAMTQAAGPALVRALQRGHLELVELLLAHSAKVNMRNCWDRTPLWHSACHGSADTVQALFDAGAVIEGTVDSDGDASLFMLAVTKRVSRAARDLLHNISPDKDCVRTLQGTEEPLTPKVLRRVIEEQAAVAKVLAKHGAMENEPRCDGLLPSERFAFEHDLAAILQRSLDMDPENLDRYDHKKRTFLLHDVEHNCHEIAQLLLFQGADVFKTDWKGRTPLELAQDDRMVRILYSGMSFP